MKREFLRGLDLEDDQINSIMKEYSGSISSLQDSISDKDEEIQNLKDEKKNLEEKQKSEDDFKEDGLTASQWKEKYEELDQEKTKMINTAKLDKELSSLNAYDLETLKKSLDMDKVEFTEEGIVGLEDQISSLKENKSFLFKTEDPKETRFSSFDPPSGSGETPSAMEQEINSVFED